MFDIDADVDSTDIFPAVCVQPALHDPVHPVDVQPDDDSCSVPKAALSLAALPCIRIDGVSVPTAVMLDWISDATFAAVSAIGVAGDAVLLPMMLLAARFAIIASVTADAAMVAVAEPGPDAVTFPVNAVM